MFGLTFEKLLLIGIIAVFVLGPERLPTYAAKLAQLVRTVRDMANGAKTRMKDEMGEDFEDVDWKKLDPRQYDPRRIIREALLDDDTPARPPVVRPVTRSTNRPDPAYLQHKAKSAGGPEAVAAAAGAAVGAGAAAGGAAGAAAGAATAAGGEADATAAENGPASVGGSPASEAPVVVTPPSAVYDSEAT